MKVTAMVDQRARIIAGLEPVKSVEIEVDLGTLTEDQRRVLVEMRDTTLAYAVRGTTEEVVAEIDRRLAAEVAAKAEQDQGRARLEQWMVDAAAVAARTESEYGIKWTIYEIRPLRPWAPAAAAKYLEHERILQAEAARLTEAAKAAVQPQIDAARAAAEAQAKIEADAKAAQLAARNARRLETGVVTISITRGDRREWGEPWIARLITRNGRRPDYDFSAGSYDPATELLTIPCKPGQTIAWGQKNYRRPERTIHEVRTMSADGSLKS